jgi:Ribbon-helix-helix protein, copG family
MNFNIYLDDETGEQLGQLAKKVGESRNALIRQAVTEWLNRHDQPTWPTEVLNFEGDPSLRSFELWREELKKPQADPLA